MIQGIDLLGIDTKDLLSGSVKDIDTKGRVITGYLSSFGNIDHDGDIIESGAFTKTISERMDDIFFLYQHSWMHPMEKFKVLKEDSFGLYFESNPLPNTTYANDAIELYDSGVLKEHSIGFNVIKADYDRDTDIRRIKEIKLYEGSVVTLGANSNTPFSGRKSITKKEINEYTRTLLKAFRNGKFSDDTFGLLEIAIKQLQEQSANLAVATYKESLEEPSLDTRIEPSHEKEKEILNDYLKKWN